MSTTPGKGRQSGIPGPGRSSGIPTPGRSRSSSSVIQPDSSQQDVEYMSRAFADAIKANDPAKHRSVQPNAIISATLSPQTASFSSQSGRRSVAGRPSSVASTSSAASSGYPKERAKTPISARPPSRPPSRHSDVFGRGSSREFEVGDNVRIESLGYEGTLRFKGEIDGKVGVWAGVELSGGFAGKGKNNGTVNGKRYFSCPDNCGVFVATVKLSPPTVGAGAIPRPSSVASSRGGRITPALSGRVTPSDSSTFSRSRISASNSLSNGRTTPSMSGRITPSFSSGRITPGVTPAARARRTLTKSTASKPDTAPPTDQFTAGSRASKYMSMTAKQLSSRDAGPDSPSRRIGGVDSPIRSLSSPSRTLSSPTRLTGSPFSTPKPSLSGRAAAIGGGLPTPNKGRPSLSTPRARIPSAIAMPPPASPISRSMSLQEHRDSAPREGTPIDLESHGKALQDRINLLKSSRPDSVSSMRPPSADDLALVDQLQSRIDALEYDNERLRAVNHVPDASPVDVTQLEAAQKERDEALSRISDLEASLSASEYAFNDAQRQVSSSEGEHQKTIKALEDQRSEHETIISTLQAQVDEHAALVKTLQTELSEQEVIIQENAALVNSRGEEITTLTKRLEDVSTELRIEKQDMGAQIDELRMAGQETIALYEERLSAADTQRYEHETRIASLETRLQNAQNSSPRVSLQSGVSSATQIDNETLREQVLHLQRKISMMEDTIEDTHAASEREEAVLRERMKRLKDKEDAMKKELNDGRKEVDRMIKSEATARNRVEEIEEALRESTVALENARAEVESMRAELADLDGLVANSTGGDLSSRVAEVTQRASSDRARYNEEIAGLQALLEEYQERETDDSQVSALRETNALLQNSIAEVEAKAEALSRALDARTNELESLKKKSNRDVTINNGVATKPASPSSKHDLSAAREEITGLKHIVQDLQKDNLAITQQIKILESENNLLSSEAAQLRQEVQILEENLDQSFSAEDNTISAVPGQDSPRKLKEQKTQLEMEQEQLQKRLKEAEMKSARTIHDLNKEISELEALVESKIYREDELEQELERMRERLSRHKKSSKGSTEPVEVKMAEAVCEICERPGHDIFNCDVLNKGGTTAVVAGPELFCEDCESHGHVAEDCPHSLDVF